MIFLRDENVTDFVLGVVIGVVTLRTWYNRWNVKVNYEIVCSRTNTKMLNEVEASTSTSGNVGYKDQARQPLRRQRSSKLMVFFFWSEQVRWVLVRGEIMCALNRKSTMNTNSDDVHIEMKGHYLFYLK